MGIVGITSPTLAAPAGCTTRSDGLVIACDQQVTAAGPRGPIGLVGDSVLLGSNDGMSTPGLPTLLKGDGWGPIRMTTSLGMRSRNSTKPNASAYDVLGRWKAAGFNPTVIVVNLGANHISDCTPSSVATCKARIDEVLDRIATLYPTATVWWSKALHETYGKGTGYSLGMRGWNAALDQAAAQRPRLVLWDWPKAVATANPPIRMDDYNVHPVSGTEYVKRSRLVLADLALRMPAHYSGPRATLPTPGPALLEYTPARPPERVFTTLTADAPALVAGAILDLDLSASPGIPADAAAAAFTVTVSNASAAGTLRIARCGTTATVPSLRYEAGRRVSAQVISPLTSDRHVCITASSAIDIGLWTQGTFAPDSATGQRLTALPKPLRTLTPTVTVPVGDAADLQLTLPLGGDGIALNATIIDPSAGGNVALHQCDVAPTGVMHVAFTAGSTASAAVFVPTEASMSTQVCARVRMPAGSRFRLALDTTGVLRTNDTGARFRPLTAARRLLDTSPTTRVGGWYGRHVLGQRIDVPVAPAGAVAVTGNVVTTASIAGGAVSAASCASARPSTAVASARAGGIGFGGVTTSVDTQGRLCLWNSTNSHTAFDVSGWWQTTA